MKKITKKIGIFALIACFCFSNLLGSFDFELISIQAVPEAAAAFNPQINYQGKLTDTGNSAVADGNYNLAFKLCASDTCDAAGDPIWREAYCLGGTAATSTCSGGADGRVAITNALFSVLLGAKNNTLSNVDFNQTLYLEVAVGGTNDDPNGDTSWETLYPRKKLGAVPAAFIADKLTGDKNQLITGDWSFHGSLNATSTNIDNSTTTGSGYFGHELYAAGILRIASTTATTTGVIYFGEFPFTRTSSNGSTFVGKNAGFFSTSTFNNSAFGEDALGALTTGWANDAFGRSALGNNTTGWQNNAFGTVALWANTSGNRNTANGRAALHDNTTGSYNTALGWGAGYGGDNFQYKNVTGNYNVFLGYNSGPEFDNLDNAIAIGASSTVAVSNAMVLGGTGDFAVSVGINTTTPGGYWSEKLTVNGRALVSEGIYVGTSTDWLMINNNADLLGPNIRTADGTNLAIKPFGNGGVNFFSAGNESFVNIYGNSTTTGSGYFGTLGLNGEYIDQWSDISALSGDFTLAAWFATTTWAGGNKLGVGTSTAKYQLTVNTDDNTTGLFQVATTTNQTIFNIDENGYIGIGTKNPNAQLNVVSHSDSVDERGVRITQYGNGVAKLVFSKAEGTEAAPAIVANDERLGGIFAEAYTGADRILTASIGFRVNGTVDATHAPTDILFSTSDTALNSIISKEKMRLTSDGKLALATTTPGYAFVIATSTSDASGQFAGFMQVASSTNQGIFLINNNGNIGINTTTPGGAYGEKLTVVGKGYFTDNLIVGTSTNAISLSLLASGNPSIQGTSGKDLFIRPNSNGNVVFFSTGSEAGVQIYGNATTTGSSYIGGDLTVGGYSSTTTGLFTSGQLHVGGMASSTFDGNVVIWPSGYLRVKKIKSHSPLELDAQTVVTGGYFSVGTYDEYSNASMYVTPGAYTYAAKFDGDVIMAANATTTGSLEVGDVFGLDSEFFSSLTGAGLFNSEGVLSVQTDLFAPAGFNGAWQNIFSNTLTPTSTGAGFYVTGSSTVAANFRIDGNATTTGHLTVNNILYVKNGLIGIGIENPTTTAALHVVYDSVSDAGGGGYFEKYGAGLSNFGIIASSSGANINVGGGFISVSGKSPNNTGIYGIAENASDINRAGYFKSKGTTGANDYGIYAFMESGTSGEDYAGYFDGDLKVTGNTTTTGNLYVGDLNIGGYTTSTFNANIAIANGKDLQVSRIYSYSPLLVNADTIFSGQAAFGMLIDPDSQVTIATSTADGGRTALAALSINSVFSGNGVATTTAYGQTITVSSSGKVGNSSVKNANNSLYGLKIAASHTGVTENDGSPWNSATKNVYGVYASSTVSGAVVGGDSNRNNYGSYTIASSTDEGSSSNYGAYGAALNGDNAYGVYGVAGNAVGINYGVYGVAGDNLKVSQLNYGGYFSAIGTSTALANYGIYAEAAGADTNTDVNFGGYFSAIDNAGAVNIGSKAIAKNGPYNLGYWGEALGFDASTLGNVGALFQANNAPTGNNIALYSSVYDDYTRAMAITGTYAGYFDGDTYIAGNATSSHFAATEICLGNDCQTAWPTSSSGGGQSFQATTTDKLGNALAGLTPWITSTTTASWYAPQDLYVHGNATTTGNISIATTTNANSGVITVENESFIQNYGSENMFIGKSAGNFSLTTAIQNMGIGKETLSGLTTGDYNIALGYQALKANTTAYGNTALGYQALKANTTAYGNTAIGYQALLSNTTDGYGTSFNTAIGYQALNKNTDGFFNTAIGAYALFNNTHWSTESGNTNTAIGYQALYNNTHGDYNIAVGKDTLLTNTTGGSNVAIGNSTLRLNLTGTYNTAIGEGALYHNSTGNSNVAIGYYAGHNELGSNAFYVDNQSRSTTALDKSQALLYGNFAALPANQFLTINAHLNVTGTSTFSNNISITGNVTTTGYLTVGTAPAGAVYGNGNLNLQANLIAGGYGQFNNVSTTDTLFVGGYASSTGGLFTQGSGHYGGNLTIDGSATSTKFNADYTYNDGSYDYVNLFKTGHDFVETEGSWNSAMVVADLYSYVTSTDYGYDGEFAAGQYIKAGGAGSGGLVVNAVNGAFGADISSDSATAVTAYSISGDGAYLYSDTGYGARITTASGQMALWIQNDDASQYGVYSYSGVNYFGNAVGIATTTPWAGYELAVDGDAVFTGNIYTLGYVTSTTGLFTQGNSHIGGAFTVDGNATTSGRLAALGGNSDQWNQAYAWGNPANANGAWQWNGWALTPTSTTAGIFVNASSTFNDDLLVNGQAAFGTAFNPDSQVAIGTSTAVGGRSGLAALTLNNAISGNGIATTTAYGEIINVSNSGKVGDAATTNITSSLYGLKINASHSGDTENDGSAWKSATKNVYGVYASSIISGAVVGGDSNRNNYGSFAIASSTDEGNSVNYGAVGAATNGDTAYGVTGLATDATGSNYGGFFSASGGGTTINYGVAATASGASYNYGGYFTLSDDAGGNNIGAAATVTKGPANIGYVGSAIGSEGSTAYNVGALLQANNAPVANIALFASTYDDPLRAFGVSGTYAGYFDGDVYVDGSATSTHYNSEYTYNDGIYDYYNTYKTGYVFEETEGYWNGVPIITNIYSYATSTDYEGDGDYLGVGLYVKSSGPGTIALVSDAINGDSAYLTSDTGTGAYIASDSGYGASIYSNSGIALSVTTNSGPYGAYIDSSGDVSLYVTNNISGKHAIYTNNGLIYFKDQVGIGTTTPTAILQVHKDAASGSDVMFAISTSTAAGAASNTKFKILASGDYQTDGTLQSGDADYAEYFYTIDTNLTAGEAVCIDITRNDAVSRCTRASDTNIIGIISTEPSILGNFKESYQNDPHYKAVALLGQIPAKVSAENGAVRPGDSLSAASLPGHIMKSNPGDSTVGVALQGLDAGTGIIKILISRRNKTVTVEEVEKQITQNIAEMEIEDEVQLLVSQTIADYDLGSEVRGIVDPLLSIYDAKIELNVTELTDKIAGVDARVIQNSAQIKDLQDKASGFALASTTDWLQTEVAMLQNQASTTNQTINLIQGQVALVAEMASSTAAQLMAISDSGDTSTLSVKYAAVEAEFLVVREKASFAGSILVIGEAGFQHKVTFYDDIEIKGKVYASKDQAGSATIKANTTSTEIIFDKEYLVTPKVVANLAGDDETTFVNFKIVRKSANGFSIILQNPVDQDVTFDWIALAVKSDPPIITGLDASAETLDASTTVELQVSVFDPDTKPEELKYVWELSPSLGLLSGDGDKVTYSVNDNVSADTDVTVTVSVTDGATLISQTKVIKVIPLPVGAVAGAESAEIPPSEDLLLPPAEEPITPPAEEPILPSPEPPAPVLGCTNNEAANYNPAATEDDGSCVLP